MLGELGAVGTLPAEKIPGAATDSRDQPVENKPVKSRESTGSRSRAQWALGDLGAVGDRVQSSLPIRVALHHEVIASAVVVFDYLDAVRHLEGDS